MENNNEEKLILVNIDEIEAKSPEFEEIKITISSNRLDNFVSEIARISRNQASEMIENELVSVNCKPEMRLAKELNKEDILIIRGKGKFIISEFLDTNRKGKQIVTVKKYK